MKQVTLNIPENQFSFFMKLVHSLNFIQVADNQNLEDNLQMYNPDFVAKIQSSQQEIEDGNFIRVKKEDLQQFLGL